MKQLTKADLTARTERATAIHTAQAKLEKAVEAYNAAALAAREVVEQAIQGLNDAIADANAWIEEVRARMNEHFDDRSEAWQESEAGEAYENWLREYVALDEVEADFPDELELPESDAAENLEGLPEEP